MKKLLQLKVISYDADGERLELEALVDDIIFSEGISKKKSYT